MIYQILNKERLNNIQLLRLINTHIDTNKKVIFQSTYLRFCKNKNVKNIIMIHDCTHQYFFKGCKKIINNIQKRNAIKNADGIICISENTKRDLLKLFPESKNKPIEVIYNCSSKEYRKLNDIDNITLNNKYKDIENKKFFIYVGDRTNYKNTNFLFDILKYNKNINCVLIGGSDFNKEEQEYIKGIEERIFRYTKVNNEDLNILYNKALCLIYPSLYEGFGIPILEAMNAGCPVIAFNNSSIPEVMQDSGILLENNDLLNCLNYIDKLSDEKFRKEIIEKQFKIANKFSWDVSYKKLIDFYRKIIND